MSVGNVSAHAFSPPLRSLTFENPFSRDFIVFTANCESFPNLQTTKTGLSRDTEASADSASSVNLEKGISRAFRPLRLHDLLVEFGR